MTLVNTRVTLLPASCKSATKLSESTQKPTRTRSKSSTPLISVLEPLAAEALRLPCTQHKCNPWNISLVLFPFLSPLRFPWGFPEGRQSAPYGVGVPGFEILCSCQEGRDSTGAGEGVPCYTPPPSVAACWRAPYDCHGHGVTIRCASDFPDTCYTLMWNVNPQVMPVVFGHI